MYQILQIYWWCLIALLGGILVFMMFVQGAQTLVRGVKDEHKDLMLNSAGKKWELTFTTLVMFGGACFAAFPLFYATSFGGAYWPWLAILFCFIIQAVSYEFRKKPNNFVGQKTYEIFLFINGSIAVILIGIVVSTFFSGSEFSLNSNNFVTWDNKLRGLESLKNPLNWLLGIALFFQARVGGALYLMNHIAENDLIKELKKGLKKDALFFLIFTVAFMAWIVLKDGYSVNESGIISIESFKYLKNYIQMPIVLLLLVVGLILTLLGIYKGAFTNSIRGIFPYGFGVTAVVMSVFLVAGLNNTAFYPSYTDIQSSLHIYIASSSFYTLKVMFVVSLWAPVVLFYIWYVWKQMDREKLTKDDLNTDSY
ncbi:MAG: cytochrome d ubiquinol oxidase subunit II [Campylobacter sp.]|nr:cytochrome d ubiquinol oxidase subunit II [Campylobacter sp.]